MHVNITVTAMLKIWREEIIEGSKTFTFPLPKELADQIAAAPSQLQRHLPQESVIHAVTLHQRPKHTFVQITVSSVLAVWDCRQINDSKVFVVSLPQELAEQLLAAEASLQQHLPKEHVIFSATLCHDSGQRVADVTMSLD